MLTVKLYQTATIDFGKASKKEAQNTAVLSDTVRGSFGKGPLCYFRAYVYSNAAYWLQYTVESLNGFILNSVCPVVYEAHPGD